jgi:uncharacterized spore protein YtfJ
MPNVDRMWAGARKALTVRRVYGEPIEQDGVTVIPAAAIRGGAGGGGDNQDNGGGGFGIGGRPIGAYVIANGRVRWKPALDVNRLLFLTAALVYLLARRRTRG